MKINYSRKAFEKEIISVRCRQRHKLTFKKLIMQTFELKPVNGRKSFGCKARVIIENKKAKLLSYDTIVAEYDLKSKKFVINGKYSATTNTHINSFKSFYKIN